MKKFICVLICTCAYLQLSAADMQVTIALAGAADTNGKVHVSVFDSKEGYKSRKPLISRILPSKSESLSVDIPEGEYLVSVYVDANDNGKLDTGFMGIPKEPVGISNYDGKSIPGGFDKHKVKVGPSQNTIRVRVSTIAEPKKK